MDAINSDASPTQKPSPRHSKKRRISSKISPGAKSIGGGLDSLAEVDDEDDESQSGSEEAKDNNAAAAEEEESKE